MPKKAKATEKRRYNVTLPVAGHIRCTVEATSEEEAIEQAFQNIPADHDFTWETLRKFHEGNVCHCEGPWEAEAELEDE